MNALDRSARWLARRTGSDTRAAELQSHLDEARERGETTSIGDIASLGWLAGRTALIRVLRDLPWWFAGLPVALFSLLLLALTYETHFPAWDFVGPGEVAWTRQARVWSTIVNVATVLSVITALIAGRRLVERLRRGQLFLPIGLLLVMITAASQIDLFIERSSWYRSEGPTLAALRAEHVNELQPYSLALYGTFAFIPIGFLLIDRLWSTRLNSDVADGEVLYSDAAAIASVFLPVLLPVIGFFALASWFVAIMASDVFSVRLKAVVVVVLVVPLVGATVWELSLAQGSDDPPTWAVLGSIAAFVLVWLWSICVTIQSWRASQRSRVPARPTSIA